MLRAKFIKGIELLGQFVIFFLVLLNLALIEAFYFLLIFSVKRLNFLYDECLLIFKLSYFRPDPLQQMLDFITF